MKLKSIYRLAFLGSLVAFAGCAGDELDGASSGNVPESVAVTLTVSRPGDASTRTELTEDPTDGTLTSKWTTGDKLLVVTSDGVKAGELTLKEGAETTKGVFSGDLKIADGTEATLWYLGASNGDAVPYTSASGQSQVTLTTDLSGKENSPKLGASFDDLKRAELLKKEGVEFTVKNGVGYVKTESVLLDQMMAMAHFTLTFPDGFSVSDGATLTVNSEKGDLPNVKTWLPANSPADASYGYTFTLGTPESDGKDIVVSNNTADLHIPIIPGKYKLTFSVNSGEKQYSCSLQEESTISAGVYYTSGESEDPSIPSYVGISVLLKGDPTEDDEVVGPTFTIKNRQGKEVKVRFTRANLHYRTADNTYYIPDLQTDMVHNAGRANNYLGNYSSVESIDLFRWGATGFKDERREIYSPETEYSKSRTPLKDTDLPYVSSDVTSPNGVSIDMRTEKNQYVDWGWCYGYQQSGKKDYYFNDIYFTLSATEWSTIVNQYVYVCATVNGVQGLLMLDCNDDAEAKALLKKYNLISADSDYVRITPSYMSNHKTSFKWNQVIVKDYNVLKEMNAVFFPKAGTQLPGISNPTKLDKLQYWLSSVPNSGTQTNANNLFLRLLEDSTSADFLISSSYGAKRTACSVRLVKVVETPEDDEVVGGK